MFITLATIDPLGRTPTSRATLPTKKGERKGTWGTQVLNLVPQENQNGLLSQHWSLHREVLQLALGLGSNGKETLL